MHIDWWTLLLQAGNALILVWLLARYLFRPVSAMIAARQTEAKRLLDEAAAARAEAERAKAEAAQELASVAAAAERLRAEALAEAEASAAALKARAEKELAQTRAEAEAAIAREREAAWRALEQKAADLAVAIAARLLQRLPPEAIHSAMLAAFETMLASLPEGELRLLATDAHFQVLSPAPLSPAEQERLRALLQAKAGRAPALEFRVEPKLLGGMELIGPHVRLRASWRADLERIAAELDKDQADGERTRDVA